MSIDRFIGILSLILSVLGIAATLVVAMNATRLDVYGTRRRWIGSHEFGGPNTQRAGAEAERGSRRTHPAPADDLVAQRSRNEKFHDELRREEQLKLERLRRERRESERSSRISGSSPSTDVSNELVGFLVSAIVVFAIFAGLAVLFLEVELIVLRTAAIIAIVVTVCAFIVVIANYKRGPVSVRWTVALFIGDAGVGFTPSLFTHPLLGGGRFEDLPAWLPKGVSLADRTKALLKIYDTVVVLHVVLQALGLLLIVGATFVAAVVTVRRSLGRAGSDGGTMALFVATLIVGFVLAAGLPVAIAGRLGTHSWTQDSVSVTSVPPPVGLFRSRTGSLEVVVARCGEERLLSISVNGTSLAASAPHLRSGGLFIAPMTTPAGPIEVKVSSTRYFETTLKFRAAPRPGGFIGLSPTETYQALAEPGRGC